MHGLFQFRSLGGRVDPPHLRLVRRVTRPAYCGVSPAAFTSSACSLMSDAMMR
jgi:hypothetical protein